MGDFFSVKEQSTKDIRIRHVALYGNKAVPTFFLCFDERKFPVFYPVKAKLTQRTPTFRLCVCVCVC